MKFKRLTQKDFDTLKILQGAGVKAPQGAEIIGKSKATAYWVYQADTLDGYFDLVRTAKKKREVKEEKFPFTEAQYQAVVDGVTSFEPAKSFDTTNTLVSVLKNIEYQNQLTNTHLEKVIILMESLLEKRRGIFQR